MVLGLSSFAFGWSIGVGENSPSNPMREIDLVKSTASYGLRCLQIGDNLPLHTFSRERLDTLKDILEKQDIRLEVGARKLTTENFQRYIQLASFFHSPLLRFVIDGDDYEPDLPAVTSLLKSFVPELEKRQIILGIENHDRLKAKDLAALMKAVNNKQVGICLDCVNSMGAGEGLEYVVDLLATYTVNFHIKDFNVERLWHKMGFTITGTPAGEGLSNIPMIMEKLKPFNRCDSAVLEQWVPLDQDIELICKKENDWAQKSIHYLKGLPYFSAKNDLSISKLT